MFISYSLNVKRERKSYQYNYYLLASGHLNIVEFKLKCITKKQNFKKCMKVHWMPRENIVLAQRTSEPILTVHLYSSIGPKKWRKKNVILECINFSSEFYTFSRVPASSLFKVETIWDISNHGLPSSVTAWNLKRN